MVSLSLISTLNRSSSLHQVVLKYKHPAGPESVALNLTSHEALMDCFSQKQAQLICCSVNRKQPIGHILALSVV